MQPAYKYLTLWNLKEVTSRYVMNAFVNLIFRAVYLLPFQKAESSVSGISI